MISKTLQSFLLEYWEYDVFSEDIEGTVVITMGDASTGTGSAMAARNGGASAFGWIVLLGLADKPQPCLWSYHEPDRIRLSFAPGGPDRRRVALLQGLLATFFVDVGLHLDIDLSPLPEGVRIVRKARADCSGSEGAREPSTVH